MEPLTETFASNGNPVPIELILPPGTGPVPVVLLLHGSFGPLPPYRADMLSFAESLADKGIATALPHYLEATGNRPGLGLMSEIAGSHPLWRRVCGEALTLLVGDDRFDTGRVGLLGFSLGGLLALGLALDPPTGATVHAIVDFFGPAQLLAAADWTKLPPALIQHGSADTLVRPDHSDWLAKELEAVGKVKGTDYWYDVYPGQGHGFTGAALADARKRTVEFLESRLTGTDTDS